MIEGLQPYSSSAMKPMARTSSINVPWLDSIPAHWKIVRSKGLFAPRKERARPEDEQLSATQAFGVIPQAEFERRVGRKVVRITQHLDKRAHVEPDDFVISMRSFQGGLERAWARGCIRSSYVVLKPSPEVRVGYFAHLFKCQDYIRALQATSNFIRDGQDLNMNNFVLVDLPLPSPDEQSAIARFLDHVNRKIDRFIRAKRKLIALLGEQKQAIIHRAVTRGLNPNAPLKPSGIPWLGDIPQHWEVRPVRALFTEIKERGHEGEPMLSVTIKRGVITQAELLENSIKRDSSNEDKSKYKLLLPGDIGYNKMRAWQGAFGVSAYRGIISPAYIVVRPTALADSQYYHFLFRTPAFAKVAESWSYGIASDMWSLRPEHFRLIEVPVPPKPEQACIAGQLNKELAGFNIAIARTEREIALMQEYRTRLTADVVTGKLDVRPAAAHLPDPVAQNVPPTVEGGEGDIAENDENGDT
ncbi:MAG: restriction endonuclease subunit S [Verrucomicrobiota bacterium]